MQSLKEVDVHRDLDRSLYYKGKLLQGKGSWSENVEFTFTKNVETKAKWYWQTGFQSPAREVGDGELSEEIGNTEKQKRKYSLVGKEAQLPFIKVKEIQKYKYCEGGRKAQLTWGMRRQGRHLQRGGNIQAVKFCAAHHVQIQIHIRIQIRIEKQTQMQIYKGFESAEHWIGTLLNLAISANFAKNMQQCNYASCMCCVFCKLAIATCNVVLKTIQRHSRAAQCLVAEPLLPCFIYSKEIKSTKSA